jgi:hypothetical protein
MIWIQIYVICHVVKFLSMFSIKNFPFYLNKDKMHTHHVHVIDTEKAEMKLIDEKDCPVI